MYPAVYGENSRFPSAKDFQIVQRFGSFGLGVVSYKSFAAGDLVAEFSGDLVSVMTQHTLQIEPGLHLLDQYFAGYFLHSCAPNISVDMKTRRVIAARNIAEHDFLEMDYAETEQILFKQFPCNCGALNCRKWITGSSERPDEQDSAYIEFLSANAVRVEA